jgi:PAS domain S-box-containing protein
LRAIAEKNNRRLLCLALLACSVFVLSVNSLAEQLPVKTYTTSDGLARDSVSRIYQDSHGFLWLCTPEGLSRFDGYKFINYGTDQGLPHRSVNDILEARDGTYWIATGHGLVRFNPNGRAAVMMRPTSAEQPSVESKSSSQAEQMFVVYYPGESDSENSINVILQDQRGAIWCGTSAGLFRLNQINGEWKFEIIDLGTSIKKMGAISALLEDGNGSVWVGAYFGLYRRSPEGRTEFYGTEQGLPSTNVISLLKDRAGRMWVGWSAGFYHMVVDADEGKRAIVAEIYGARDGVGTGWFQALHQSADGELWVATGNGLLESQSGGLDKRNFRIWTQKEGLSDNHVTAITEDRDGNLWVGTESGGLMKIMRHGFISYHESDGLGSARIASILETKSGKLGVLSSSTQQSINIFDGKRFVATPIKLPKGIVHGWGWNQISFQDHTGDWWITTYSGVYRYPHSAADENLPASQPKNIYQTKEGLKDDSIFRLFEDSKGDVWISSFAPDYLMRWERASDTLHHYRQDDGSALPSAPTVFREDTHGNIWIGLYSGGVARYRDGHLNIFTSQDGLGESFIRDLFVDQRGRLWAATGRGGLSRLDDTNADQPRFITLTTADGLASNQITCLTEDEWGRLYVGTARGLDELDPEINLIKHYTMADGLPDNFINTSFRDHNGVFWFGTLRGLARFSPEPKRETAPPSILLSGLRISSVPYHLSELGVQEISSPDLNPDQNQLQIDFLSLNFISGEILRYQYKLEGADADWSTPTAERTVNYARLAPGKYRFLVRAVNSEGVVSKIPAQISFSILPPIWRRWWFLSLAALVIVLTLFAIDRYRVNRMKELDAALTESKQLTETLTEQRSELSKANRTLELEYDVTNILGESTTPDEAAPKILEVICRSTGWDIGAIWYVDEESKRLRCQEVWYSVQLNATDFEAHTLAQTFAGGEGLPGRVWQSGEAQWIADLTVEANFPRLAAALKEDLKSAFGFPITLEGEVIGVLEFFSVETRQRDDELLEMMSTVGGQIGQLIERRRADEALRESEDRFRTLAETASDAIITIDEASRIIYVNEAAEHVFGYSIAEMLGADLTILMPEYLRHLHEAGLNRYIATGHKHIGWEAVELPGLHKSGREIPLELSFGEFTKNEQRFFTGIARDVTERKQAEEALQRSREERLRELERVRTRIATDLHDDIGSSLTQIVVLSEVARQRVDGNDALLGEPLTKITRVSNELVEAMSDIVWAINPKKDHLSDLVQRMRRFASDIFAPCQIRLNLRTQDTDGHIQLGANIRRELFLIFKESVNNIAKHSGCTEAQIEFYQETNSLVLKLTDNGKGFDPSRVSEHTDSSKGGNGLISMQRRAVELGGSFEITSTPGQGTSTTLKVPLGQPTLVESSHPNGR